MLITAFATQPDKEAAQYAELIPVTSTERNRSSVPGGSLEAGRNIAVAFLDDLNFFSDGVGINSLGDVIIKKLAVMPRLLLGGSSDLSGLNHELQTSNNGYENTVNKRRTAIRNDGATQHELNKEKKLIKSAQEHRREVFKMVAVGESKLGIKVQLFGHSLFPFNCLCVAGLAALVYWGGERQRLST